jgi:acyl dehydratase
MHSEIPPLFLDDLVVGQTYDTDELQVTRDDIIEFATKYDPQPFHLDDAAAAASLFRGLAASGWHTAALTMRLLVDSGIFGGGGVGAGMQVNWPTPTRPGDILFVRATVATITPSRSKPDRGIVEVHCETLTRDGQLRQDLMAKLLVFRKHSAA